METTATLRGVRLSAQKGRLVADMVRGMPVAMAMEEKAMNLYPKMCFREKTAITSDVIPMAGRIMM